MDQLEHPTEQQDVDTLLDHTNSMGSFVQRYLYVLLDQYVEIHASFLTDKMSMKIP